MQRAKQFKQFIAHSFSSTRPKEGTIMKTQLSSFVRRCAVQVLALVGLAASSAVAQPVPDQHGGQALQFHGNNWMEASHIEKYNEDLTYLEASIYIDQLGGKQEIITKENSLSLSLNSQGNVCLEFASIDSVVQDYVYSSAWEVYTKSRSYCDGRLPVGEWAQVRGEFKKNSIGHLEVEILAFSQSGSLVAAVHENITDEARDAFSNYADEARVTVVDTDDPLIVGRGFKGRIDEVKVWHGASVWTFDELSMGNNPPQITLNGSADMTLNVGETYVEEGATATSQIDEQPVVDSGSEGNDGVYYIGGGQVTLPVSISGNVGTAIGDYTLTYTATDANGTTATVDRLVHVLDGIPPVITLNGPAEEAVDEGDGYADPGATATDDVDGSVAVSVDMTIDASTPAGDYTLTYTATDAAGNAATATRLVQVQALIDGGGTPISFEGEDQEPDFETDWQYELDVKDVGVAADGTVWAIYQDGKITSLNNVGGSFHRVGTGPAKRIDGCPDYGAVVVMEDGSVERYNKKTGARSVIPGSGAVDVACGADGSVWAAGLNPLYQIWRLDDQGNWEDMGVQGSRIDVSANGMARVVQFDEDYFGADHGSVLIGDSAGNFSLVDDLRFRDIGIGGTSAWGVVWGIGVNGRPYKWFDGGWKLTNGDLSTNISVDNNGQPWSMTWDGRLWYGTPQ